MAHRVSAAGPRVKRKPYWRGLQPGRKAVDKLGMKILIVDSDVAARERLAGMLGGGACEVSQARDGDEAWALLAGGLQPAVCFSALGESGSGAFDLMRRTQQDPQLRALPFVLTIGAADRQTMHAVITSHAAGCLVQPCLPQQARAAMGRAAPAPAAPGPRAGVS